MLAWRKLRWLGYVSRMDEGRIPKEILLGELATCSSPPRRPHLQYKDILKRDMKASDINPTCWEAVAIDRRYSSGRHADKSGIQIRGKRKLRLHDRRREVNIDWRELDQFRQPSADFIYNNCNRACRSRLGLYSVSRWCRSTMARSPWSFGTYLV